MWSVASGTLPPGLSLNATTGMYTGTPTAVGAYSFTIAATNNSGMDSRAYSQTITAPPIDSNALLSNNMLGGAFPPFLPQALIRRSTITGLTAGDTLVGIDRRPQNGFLYGLGYNATNGTVQLYGISSQTAMAHSDQATGRQLRCGRRHDTGAHRCGCDHSLRHGLQSDRRSRACREQRRPELPHQSQQRRAGGPRREHSWACRWTADINGPTMSVQETAYTNSAPNVTRDHAVHGRSNDRRAYSESAEQRYADHVHCRCRCRWRRCRASIFRRP